MKFTRKLSIFAVLLALLTVWSCAVVAQDATPEAPPDMPITVEDGGTVNIGPDAAPADDGASTNSIAVIVGALVVFVLGVGSAILIGGKPADSAISERIETMRLNQQAVTEMRQAVRDANTTTQQAIRTLETIVKAIAPMTPAKSDDAFGNLLDDITPDDTQPLPPASSQPLR